MHWQPNKYSNITWFLMWQIFKTSSLFEYQGASTTRSVLVLVRLHGCCYYYSEASQRLVKSPRMPADLPYQLSKAVLALEEVEQGKSEMHAHLGLLLY